MFLKTFPWPEVLDPHNLAQTLSFQASFSLISLLHNSSISVPYQLNDRTLQSAQDINEDCGVQD